ncbi:MAG: hypothetical protein LCI00_30210 [Chloroflexi bacterium]|nr:hypothetical protein [Chloroflexota bacterium]MCC6892841.1 hypothetical protein [Anaerolineae bacterium]
MNILRKHWLLILLIVVGLTWWQLVPLFLPSPLDPSASLQQVDYWSIVTNPNWFDIAVFGLVIVVILILFRAWRIENLVYRSLLIVIFVLLFSRSICVDFILAEESEGRTVRNLTTIEYNGKAYHLAKSTNSHSRGVPEFDYLVFECDAAGQICSEIFKAGGYGYDKQPIELVVDDERLVLDWYKETQILPTVNN